MFSGGLLSKPSSSTLSYRPFCSEANTSTPTMGRLRGGILQIGRLSRGCEGGALMLTNILFFYSHFLKSDIPVVDFVYFR